MVKKKNRYRTARKNRQGMIRKGLKTVFGLSAAVVLVLLLSAGLAYCYHALLDAPWLRVGEVEITGLKNVDRRQVLNALKVPRDVNALTVKLSDLAKRVEALPWVKSAVVRLDLPGRLVVEIEEREPLALLFAGEFLLLDSEGKLFAHSDPENRLGLLVLTGFSGMSLREGGTFPARPMRELRRLLAVLKKAQNWLPSASIMECQWRGDEGFVLFVTEKSIPVQLGSEDPELVLGRLQRIFTLLTERRWLDGITRIDMDYPNRAYLEGRFGT